MTRSAVARLVGWLVGEMVGWSVKFFLKGGEFHFHAPNGALVGALQVLKILADQPTDQSKDGHESS